jgi:hypothetical protein
MVIVLEAIVGTSSRAWKCKPTRYGFPEDHAKHKLLVAVV